MEESQENTEILKHHEAHRGFLLLHKALLMRREHRNSAPTTIAVGRRYTGALNDWGKVKIRKKHQTFEANE